MFFLSFSCLVKIINGLMFKAVTLRLLLTTTSLFRTVLFILCCSLVVVAAAVPVKTAFALAHRHEAICIRVNGEVQ